METSEILSFIESNADMLPVRSHITHEGSVINVMKHNEMAIGISLSHLERMINDEEGIKRLLMTRIKCAEKEMGIV